MKHTRWPVVWGDRLVGWLEDPKHDMPHTYGKWIGNGQDGEDFLSALKDETIEDPDFLDITLDGDFHCVAREPPDESGEIDFRWAPRLTPNPRVKVEPRTKKWWQFWRSR